MIYRVLCPWKYRLPQLYFRRSKWYYAFSIYSRILEISPTLSGAVTGLDGFSVVGPDHMDIDPMGVGCGAICLLPIHPSDLTRTRLGGRAYGTDIEEWSSLNFVLERVVVDLSEDSPKRTICGI